MINPVNNLHGDLAGAQDSILLAYMATRDAIARMAKAKPHARDYADADALKAARANYESLMQSQQAIADKLMDMANAYQSARLTK